MVERTERIIYRLFLRCAALRRHLASLFPAEFPTALVLFVGLEHRRFVGVLKVFVLVAEFREHLVEERVVVDGLEALVVLVAHQAEDGDFLALETGMKSRSRSAEMKRAVLRVCTLSVPSALRGSPQTTAEAFSRSASACMAATSRSKSPVRK